MWHASSTLVDVAFWSGYVYKEDLCCATNSAGLDGNKNSAVWNIPYGAVFI